MPFPPERALLRTFWMSIRRGAPTEAAAAALGYTKRTGAMWFSQARASTSPTAQGGLNADG
jgi:hypothetical protein